jgi:polysaccharide biosynthesis protein VpsM
MRAIPRFMGLVSAGLVVFAHTAMAFATLEHGRLVGNASARVDYDSNIFVSNSQVNDTIGTLDGNVQYLRAAGIITAEAAAGLTALAFADHSSQNTVDPYVTAKMGYAPSEKTNLHSDLDYRRNSVANEFVNARTRSDDLTFDTAFEYLASEKLGLRALVEYNKSDYLTHGYSDVGTYSVGLNAVHVYSPKLKLLAGVTAATWWTQHRATSGASPNSTDWRYTIGAEGELAPKVVGSVTAGMSQRHFEHAGFQGGSDAYLAAQLAWAAAEKTTWTLTANRSLSLTAADQSLKSFSVSAGVTQVLSPKLTVECNAGWDNRAFQGFNRIGNRKDHGYTLRARANYALKDNISCDVSVGYRDNSSTFAVSTYDRVNIGAGISVRF